MSRASTSSSNRSETDDDPAGPVRIGLADVEKVELSGGLRRNAGKGAWVGALAGFGAGALFGLLVTDTDESDFFDPDAVARFFAGWGAAGGALVGVTIGALTKSERWDEVPTQRWSVSYDERSGVSVAVRFAL